MELTLCLEDLSITFHRRTACSCCRSHQLAAKNLWTCWLILMSHCLWGTIWRRIFFGDCSIFWNLLRLWLQF